MTYKDDVVKNLILFYYVFDLIWYEMFIQIVMEEVWNAYNF